MKQTYLPGTVRERLQDLMKQHKLTQSELAQKIDVAESTLSRFISGRTDKLGDESVIRIAEIFNVSTDFLLGAVDEPDRKNYDISELGLSVDAARNLYAGRVNADVMNRLLVNPHFAEATYLISRYLNDELAKGFAAQNQLYDAVVSLMSGDKHIAHDVSTLKIPVYQADLSAIQPATYDSR
ncbi:MAG: helix-turn-helix transcriptional regulator [bacterium]|nr:helix-turn-helix transcriptional regulator [bacterium]